LRLGRKKKQRFVPSLFVRHLSSLVNNMAQTKADTFAADWQASFGKHFASDTFHCVEV